MFRDSMAECPDVNYIFEEMADEAHYFFEQNGWEGIVEVNYDTSKELIDSQWEYGLISWN